MDIIIQWQNLKLEAHPSRSYPIIAKTRMIKRGVLSSPYLTAMIVDISSNYAPILM
jgi:hypothetical protein